MHRVLIVANKTLADENLRQRLAEYAAEKSCRFYVLVPTGPRVPHRPGSGVRTIRAAAGRHLYETLRFLRDMGADAAGEVSNEVPMRAIAKVLATEPFDEILVATTPPGTSGWLAQDLPLRIARAFPLPVNHFSSG